MKFAQIAKGTLARKRGVECTTLGGESFKCDLRVLNAAEEAECVAAAAAVSRAAGGSGSDRDIAYQLAFAGEAIARAAVDPDSPDTAPSAFFADVTEVRAHLDRERILLLAEAQRRFQESASPLRHELSEAEFIAMVTTLAASEEGEDFPLEGLPRFTRNHFVRTMATLLLNLQPPKSDSSLASTESEAKLTK